MELFSFFLSLLYLNWCLNFAIVGHSRLSLSLSLSLTFVQCDELVSKKWGVRRPRDRILMSTLSMVIMDFCCQQSRLPSWILHPVSWELRQMSRCLNLNCFWNDWSRLLPDRLELMTSPKHTGAVHHYYSTCTLFFMFLPQKSLQHRGVGGTRLSHLQCLMGWEAICRRDSASLHLCHGSAYRVWGAIPCSCALPSSRDMLPATTREIARSLMTFFLHNGCHRNGAYSCRCFEWGV